MTVKMIATDLDITLLRKDKTLSDYTVSVFQRCREEGIKIVFATSRPMRAVVNFDFYKQITPDGAAYHSGAVLYAGDICIEKHGISQETVNKMLLSAYNDIGVKLAVEADDKFYSDIAPLDMWPGIEVTRIDYAALPMIYADKIVFTDLRPDVIDAVSKILPEELYMQLSENKICMIMNRYATKARGVMRLAKHFGIPLSDVVAFGDDYNDVGMLRECGIGVAVADAIDEAKAAADDICDTSDNDGAAKWLEKNVLPFKNHSPG